jgi:acyl-lipid omega-6 desaturase (Delta-12 desaturase)
MTSEATKRFIDLIGEAAGTPLEQLNNVALGRHLKLPTLFMHDPEDTRVPFTDSVRASQAMPNATLEPVTGVGHDDIITAASVIARAVAFVTSED